MFIDAIREFYDYHFAINRTLWDHFVMPLSDEQFTQPCAYSVGSVRNQIVHMMNVDQGWFAELRGTQDFSDFNPDDFNDRGKLRAQWDTVETQIRAYLATITDDLLMTKPIPEGEDQNLLLIQVLLHVVNHGTDHRAQLLRQLNDLGVKTPPQDYIFYVYGHF